ncbi:MAG: Trifunctional biosynthesis/regulator protein NadR [Bacteroidota bacterium]|jgi:nicotinamide riboside kinase
MKVVITGPESVGKTTLVKKLARYYKGHSVLEFAREYIESLSGSYKFSDVEFIGRRQILEDAELADVSEWVFFDTDLIITKVWFSVVYGMVPPWVDSWLATHKRFHLLLDTSVAWEPDSVRENGGEMRAVLFERYRDELEHYGLPYAVVSGTGDVRTANAIAEIDRYFLTTL